jgi:chaperonin GroEL
MKKQLKFHQEAREALLRGVEQVSLAVESTLGPRGYNVIENNGPIRSTNDGVSVAAMISDLPDEFEDAGANIVKDAAIKMNDDVGDGTTTITAIVHHIIKEGTRLTAAGLHPALLKEGIDKATQDIIEELKQYTIPCDDIEQIRRVATLSAQDKEIGDAIADGIDQAGRDSVITLQDSPSPGYSFEIIDGYPVDAGYLTSDLINDDSGTKCVLDNPAVYVTKDDVANVNDMLPVMKTLLEVGKRNTLLIFAPSFGGEAYSTLLLNHKLKRLNVGLVRVPGVRERQMELLGDIAVITGASLIEKNSSLGPDKMTLDDFGSCDKAELSKDKTLLTGTHGKEDKIAKHINLLNDFKSGTQSEYERERITARLAALQSGIGVIYVGGRTELEQKNKKDKTEDALNAARAAIEEGVIPGGGAPLAKIAYKLRKNTLDGFERNAGYNLMLDAIQQPLKIIALNAIQKPDVILSNVEASEETIGYNAYTLEYVDLIEAGIIDPVKVTRNAVQNAASVAGLVLTTSCVVANIKTPEQPLQ